MQTLQDPIDQTVFLPPPESVLHGLPQRELAMLIGTSASAICRIEDADYDGHSMAMLRRIAEALGRRVEMRFVLRDQKKLEPA
jgi:transcriptional regulator with XRE-family HTH domain